LSLESGGLEEKRRAGPVIGRARWFYYCFWLEMAYNRIVFSRMMGNSRKKKGGGK
jgi:hypothetical protein